MVFSLGKATADDRQLVEDVEFLNTVVVRYENARGWFSDKDDAHRILSRLSYAGGDYGVPLIRGESKVELVPVLADEPPASAKWAYWNRSKKRFVVWRGSAPADAEVILKFKRSFRGRPRGAALATAGDSGAAPGTAPAPKAAAQQPDFLPEPQRPPSRPVGPEAIAAGWAAGTRAGEPRLPMPKLEPAPSLHPTADYPLAVKAVNEDAMPPGAATMVSINGGTWQTLSEGAVKVLPGDEIIAFVSAGSAEGVTDSEPVGGRYVIEPIKLQLSVATPTLELPVAAIQSETMREELYPAVSLGNFSALPESLRGGERYEVVWTIDGSDPIESDTAFPVVFDSSAGEPQRLPMLIANLLGERDELEIRAIAKSNAPGVFAHSDEVKFTLTLTR